MFFMSSYINDCEPLMSMKAFFVSIATLNLVNYRISSNKRPRRLLNFNTVRYRAY